MTEIFWLSLGWVVGASLLGFGISALFSGWLKLSRRIFLIPYVILAALFLYGFLVWSEVDPGDLISDNWIAGVIAGVLVAIFLVRNVRSQPESRLATGGELVLDLGWLGLVYGVIDALFLNVMPVLAIWHGTAGLEWATSLPGKIAIGVLALAASLLVALTYHLGYPEFRNRKVGLVLVGNGLITLAYIVSANPLGALISHTVMHLAAVIQGPESTIQLPPHLAPDK
jgi:hypothetical protein